MIITSRAVSRNIYVNFLLKTKIPLRLYKIKTSVMTKVPTEHIPLWCVIILMFALDVHKINTDLTHVIITWHSRNTLDRSNWSLNRKVFKEKNYFRATHSGHRCLCSRLEPVFLNPPWILMGRFLAKVTRQRATAEVIAIAPLWPSLYWYSQLQYRSNEDSLWTS